MIYKPTKKCELMRTKDSYVKKVNEWAVRNGYIQCAGWVTLLRFLTVQQNATKVMNNEVCDISCIP